MDQSLAVVIGMNQRLRDDLIAGNRMPCRHLLDFRKRLPDHVFTFFFPDVPGSGNVHLQPVILEQHSLFRGQGNPSNGIRYLDRPFHGILDAFPLGSGDHPVFCTLHDLADLQVNRDSGSIIHVCLHLVFYILVHRL